MFQTKPLHIPTFASFASFSEEQAGKPLHKLDGTDIVHLRLLEESFGNHVEMAGLYASSIVSYGYDKKGGLLLHRHVVFPMLRVYPNLTHSSLSHNFSGVKIRAADETLTETVLRFVFDGCLHMETAAGDLKIKRTLFTAPNAPGLLERLVIENAGNQAVAVSLEDRDGTLLTNSRYGNKRAVYRLYCAFEKKQVNLEPEGQATFDVFYGACRKEETPEVPDAAFELSERQRIIASLDGALKIETPDEVLNVMARYAKIRASESIFRTKNGLMHSPGGGGYYAALWTNDQCEYINPLFGYLGYETGREEAVNCYRLYEQHISPKKALITSIIAEGDGVWHGAKDRGDSAMYAYGASRFLLSAGDGVLAKSFLPAIRDCLTFTLSKKTRDGIIKSDSDELENRFESGKANLSTSCLAYDALISASYLEREVGDAVHADIYIQAAAALKEAIENYFGTSVEGFDTYRYCAEEKALRSWICWPLVVGVFDRATATKEALLSDKLRRGAGLVTRSGEKTFWDRSTLYALRGLFYAGMADDAVELLTTYSQSRLLGRHIPYAVEACPEGNQAQLSAESGLYLRIFTEGILGYRPTGLRSFEIRPQLPSGWDTFAVKNIAAHGTVFSVFITRTESGYRATLSDGRCFDIPEGEAVSVTI